MRRFLIWCADVLSKLSDFPQLFFRLTLAYGFWKPMTTKLENFHDTVEWFGSMDYPVPTLAAIAVIGAEVLGVCLLPIGFLTRIVSLMLMVAMVVAITTVHWSHGFAAANGGFEIPLYYLLMLFALFIQGPGRISIDALFVGDYRKKKRQAQAAATPAASSHEELHTDRSAEDSE